MKSKKVKKVGRPKSDNARVLITAKVLQETKKKINSDRGDLSVGKFIDGIVLKGTNR